MITYDNLRQFCFSSDKQIEGTPRGIVINFMGLGGAKMYDFEAEDSVELAQNGIIYVVPYLNPWNWMNEQAVAMADEVLDALMAHYNLPNLPVLTTGSSMGGQCALVFSAYSRHRIIACEVCCPVCDMVYHITERPDLPRTMYSAFGTAPDFDAALRSRSPLHIIDRLPDVPYTIYHTVCDDQVSKALHSDRLVAAMQAAGRRVDYISVPEGGHCQLTPELQNEYYKVMVRAFK